MNRLLAGLPEGRECNAELTPRPRKLINCDLRHFSAGALIPEPFKHTTALPQLENLQAQVSRGLSTEKELL
jgi:hypothetical protein